MVKETIQRDDIQKAIVFTNTAKNAESTKKHIDDSFDNDTIESDCVLIMVQFLRN